MMAQYPRYHQLTLTNFQGFKDPATIRLAPLTFLVGPNSAGKSSIFDALLFLAQSQLDLYRFATPIWIGELADLGNFVDAVFAHNTRYAMAIGVEATIPRKHLFRARAHQTLLTIGLEFTIRGSRRNPQGHLTTVSLSKPGSEESIQLLHRGYTEFPDVRIDHVPFPWPKKVALAYFKEGETFTVTDLIARHVRHVVSRHGAKLKGTTAGYNRLARVLEHGVDLGTLTRETQHVRSGRAAPRRWYPLASEEASAAEQVSLVERLGPRILRRPPRWYLPRYLRAADHTRRHSTLSHVLKRLDIATHIIEKQLSPYHTSLRVKDSRTRVESNITDVGYGASQVLPVVTACLGKISGPLLVEQPEIHLHPKAQGEIADLLCRTSLQRQVMVETHSVHMINRARIMVAERKLPEDHVTVNFVFKDRNGSHVQEIPIDRHGEFGADWPGGFFDERYQDTLTLIKLRGDRSVKD